MLAVASVEQLDGVGPGGGGDDWDAFQVEDLPDVVQRPVKRVGGRTSDRDWLGPFAAWPSADGDAQPDEGRVCSLRGVLVLRR